MIPAQISQQIQQFIWHSESSSSAIKNHFIQFLKIISLVVKDLMGGMLSLRAMSLVYTTLLSLVPLIAVSFSVLKGFGVHNQIEPFLLNLLTPLGDKGPEITAQIISFVENMKIGVLGSIGMVMLMYTVISLISKIENAFNFTWRIKESRTAAQKFSNYLSIVMVGPVMMVAAIGMTASLASNTVIDTLNQYEAVGQMIKYIGYTLPYVMVIAMFTFVYMLIPNIRVSFKSALYGAVVSGIMWELVGRAFANFASGSTSYTAIYSGFAILILFMIWLYLGWLILLTGVNIAYYHQHAERLKWEQQKLTLSSSLREQTMLGMMLLIAKAHAKKSTETIDLMYLSKTLAIPDDTLSTLIKTLKQNDFIKVSDDKPAQFFPAQSLELISVADIIHCARQSDITDSQKMPSDSAIEKTMDQIKHSIDDQFSSKTLASLIHS